MPSERKMITGGRALSQHFNMAASAALRALSKLLPPLGAFGRRRSRSSIGERVESFSHTDCVSPECKMIVFASRW